MESTIYLTDSCNLQCTYCYQGDSKNRSFLTEETLERALKYIVNNNMPDDYIDLTFLGGEPLLNKKMLYKAIELIENRFPDYLHLFRYHITTNGILLDTGTITFLKRYNFDISISIDGDRETHNLNRISVNHEDVYSTILDNMQTMLDMGLDFSVRMTVTNNNVHLLYKNVRYFRELGARKLHIGIDHIGDWNESGLKILDEQYSLLDEFYLNHVIDDTESLINLYDFKIGIFMAKRTPAYCSAGTKGHIVINSKGEFYPCGFVTNDKTWEIGSVAASLQSDKFYQTVRNNVKNKSSCHECEIAFSCNGARCGFLNYISTGYLNLHRSLNCKLERTLYKHNAYVLEKLYEVKHPRFMKMYNSVKENNLEFGDVIQEIMGRVDKRVKERVG